MSGFIINPYAFANPGGGGSGYRYYRIYITGAQAGTDGYMSIGEMELRATAGGSSDITSPGMATTHSTEFNSSTSSDKTINNNTGDYWASDGSALPQWVAVDLGSPAAVPAQVAIWQQPGFPSRAPRDFTLQGSTSGSSWDDLATWSAIAAGSPAVVNV